MRPTIITDTVQFADLMRQAREELGVSGEELDHLCGWPERYTAKAENPGTRWGRVAFKLSENTTVWLAALGLELVLVPVEQAQEICSAGRDKVAGAGIERRRVFRFSVRR
jgi:hypothetical protein